MRWLSTRAVAIAFWLIVGPVLGLNFHQHATRPVVWSTYTNQPIPDHGGRWSCMRVDHMMMTECVELPAKDRSRLWVINLLSLVFAGPLFGLLVHRRLKSDRRRRGPWDRPATKPD
jgi:hypothetical protein